MKKFVVLFCIPAATMQDWMKTVDEAERKKQTDQMMKDWQAWMKEHDKAIIDKGMPVGKTKRVMKDGAIDVRNDVNWYLVIEANSHDEAVAMFKNHPHLQIPEAYIDVSESNMGMM
jgi:hypothetical protein